MKQQKLCTKILATLFLCLILLVPLASAQSNEDCEACHSDPDLTGMMGGRSVSMYVDFEKYSGSTHKDLDCVSCHMDAEVEEFPHALSTFPDRLV